MSFRSSDTLTLRCIMEPKKANFESSKEKHLIVVTVGGMLQ